ncbi:hypothetical protein GEMRC1_007574 [Eukaryota sp. GEM-RC1]
MIKQLQDQLRDEHRNSQQLQETIDKMKIDYENLIKQYTEKEKDLHRLRPSYESSVAQHKELAAQLKNTRNVSKLEMAKLNESVKNLQQQLRQEQTKTREEVQKFNASNHQKQTLAVFLNAAYSNNINLLAKYNEMIDLFTQYQQTAIGVGNSEELTQLSTRLTNDLEKVYKDAMDLYQVSNETLRRLQNTGFVLDPAVKKELEAIRLSQHAKLMEIHC